MEEQLPMRLFIRQLAALAALVLAGGCASLNPPARAEEPVVVASPVALPQAVPAAPAPGATETAAETTRAPASRMRLDPAQDADRGDLWERVRSGLALPDVDNELVRKWEQFYARDPAYVQRMTERGSRYLFHIVEELQRREMPTELALLPFIESAFNPQAKSRAAASGMWQFMPGTGKDFELRQNLFRDDRRDVLASTRAALDYLQRLHAKFGDWHLALAAYNWGQGNVLKALEANRRARRGLGYEDLRMPNETRNYVPKLQAMKNIVLHPEAFALTLPPLENHPFFMSVPIERDIDVDLAARLAGLTLEEFQQLNPQMNKPVILAAGTPQVLLPYDNANQFVRELGQHSGPLATWTAWVAPKTLKPAEAAQLTGMDEAQLRQVNDIPPRMLVKLGSTLLVPRAAASMADVSEDLAHHGALALAPEARPLRTVTTKAGHGGESVAAVARRHGVTPAQVAAWNGVGPHATFKAGQTIVLKMAAPATRTAGKPAHRVASKATPRKLAAAPQSKPGAAARPSLRQ
jgi:membrane-bound lytic murein transglycosylase D